MCVGKRVDGSVAYCRRIWGSGLMEKPFIGKSRLRDISFGEVHHHRALVIILLDRIEMRVVFTVRKIIINPICQVKIIEGSIIP